jgi:hypothetical protein
VALPAAIAPAGAATGPDAALVAAIEALHSHQATGNPRDPRYAGGAGGFTDEAMAEWCDQESAMMRALAAVRPASMLDLLRKVDAAFDEFFHDSGDYLLLTFGEDELALYGGAADDVKAAIRAIAGGSVA